MPAASSLTAEGHSGARMTVYVERVPRGSGRGVGAIEPHHDEPFEATCWICLGDATDKGDGPLMQPCLCPRYAHQRCLARWQLQNAGKP